MTEEKRRKRPYRAPRIKSELVYERSSLACGKTVGRRTAQCRTNPRNS